MPLIFPLTFSGGGTTFSSAYNEGRKVRQAMCDKCKAVLGDNPTSMVRTLAMILIGTLGSDPIPGGIDLATFKNEYEPLKVEVPFVLVRRKADNVEGAMMVRPAPLTFFDFVPVSAAAPLPTLPDSGRVH